MTENKTLLKPSRPVGIVGYGAYVPRYRIPAREIAQGVFLLEGIDEGGHTVSRICAEREIDAALKSCARDAREIEYQLAN